MSIILGMQCLGLTLRLLQICLGAPSQVKLHPAIPSLPRTQLTAQMVRIDVVLHCSQHLPSAQCASTCRLFQPIRGAVAHVVEVSRKCCCVGDASDADSTRTNSSKEEASSGAAAQEPAGPSGLLTNATQLSLAEARDLLDKDHYGLDKVGKSLPNLLRA